MSYSFKPFCVYEATNLQQLNKSIKELKQCVIFALMWTTATLWAWVSNKISKVKLTALSNLLSRPLWKILGIVGKWHMVCLASNYKRHRGFLENTDHVLDSCLFQSILLMSSRISTQRDLAFGKKTLRNHILENSEIQMDDLDPVLAGYRAFHEDLVHLVETSALAEARMQVLMKSRFYGRLKKQKFLTSENSPMMVTQAN